MILDEFTSVPDFPFERYFESVNQHISATQYWLRVLRSVPGFVESDWKPRVRPIELEDDMYLGKVVDIISLKLKKEINLQTYSVLGDANMLMKENQPISEEEYAEQKNLFGPNFMLEDDALSGITYEEALQEAKANSVTKPVMIWVEKGIHWEVAPDLSEGGYEVPIERLILTSEISRRAEPKAIQALELFLRPGSAMERVNSAFSPGPE
ncbi:hypothetical protein TH25_16415 [Thalassospira profundimaris]|uniref:Uncharacterized protein n=1 Tax=Thalassospira profundimaris TaxID=502049 RepID=A0A367X2W1_9PROT|nr:hypothetical protein [Thalassospira profundimaris]RCK47091.1 hypothetical protein TH25_16415 [Thalassospira profundimaris]